MLNRSIFEGVAIAHWAHAHPDRAVELFKKHGRHSELLWGDAFSNADGGNARVIDAGTQEERKELDQPLLASTARTYGPAITASTPYCQRSRTSGPRARHATSPGGSSESPIGTTTKCFTAQPPVFGLVLPEWTTSYGWTYARLTTTSDRALLGGLWCYEQTLTLLWDHFLAIPVARPDENHRERPIHI